MYILLNTCQGFVGHCEGYFDFFHCMSHIFPNVTSVHFYTSFTAPKALPGVNVETLQERKQQLVIRKDPHSRQACCSHVYALSWLLMPFARISFSNPGENRLENDIVDNGSLQWWVVNKNWLEKFSSQNILANVFAAIDYALQAMSSVPVPGRDCVSSPRLWLSYKTTASKTIGCPIVGGTLVPIFQRNVKFRKLPGLIYYTWWRFFFYLNTSIDKINDISRSWMKPDLVGQQINGRHRES